MEYETLKWLHILSSTLLFGTGLGSAFFKWSADRSGNLEAIGHTNGIVVIADWVFTTPTVIIQPITGFLLINSLGFSITEPWMLITYALYVIAAGCWLPVVWLQMRMRDISLDAIQNKTQLDDNYHRYARLWFWLGVPAFICMLIIYFLMVFKPVINFKESGVINNRQPVIKQTLGSSWDEMADIVKQHYDITPGEASSMVIKGVMNEV